MVVYIYEYTDWRHKLIGGSCLALDVVDAGILHDQYAAGEDAASRVVKGD